MIATRATTSGWRIDGLLALLQRTAPYLCLAGIGVELALLTAFLPGTVDRVLYGPVADFHNLYEPARERELPGLYNPFLVVLFQPLAWMPEMVAYRVFFAMSTLCIVAIALIAQRAVTSWEARVLVALAPLALPQVHWALRLGHLTPLLLLVALLGLLALRTHPRRAALLFAFLSIKPQYLIAPVAYLAVRREWRLLATVVGAAAAMAAVGLAIIGPSSIAELTSRYFDWGPNSSDNLLPIQQSWMVSWPGVQISLGREPHPLITLDLILLSLAVATCAWLRAPSWLHGAVVALMLIPLTPYAQFYDGALVLVAIALLLRTNLAPVMKATLCVGLYLAAIATQASVVFPVKDVLGPAHTHGVYWLTPAMVAATAIILLASGRSTKAAM
jgi:hypothetical protein